MDTLPHNAFSSGRNCPHQSASSVESTSLWPMSWTPARRRLSYGGTARGMTTSCKLLWTSPVAFCLRRCTSLLTYPGCSIPSLRTLPPQTSNPTSSSGTVKSTLLNWLSPLDKHWWCSCEKGPSLPGPPWCSFPLPIIFHHQIGGWLKGICLQGGTSDALPTVGGPIAETSRTLN